MGKHQKGILQAPTVENFSSKQESTSFNPYDSDMNFNTLMGFDAFQNSNIENDGFAAFERENYHQQFGLPHQSNKFRQAMTSVQYNNEKQETGNQLSLQDTLGEREKERLISNNQNNSALNQGKAKMVIHSEEERAQKKHEQLQEQQQQQRRNDTLLGCSSQQEEKKD